MLSSNYFLLFQKLVKFQTFTFLPHLSIHTIFSPHSRPLWHLFPIFLIFLPPLNPSSHLFFIDSFSFFPLVGPISGAKRPSSTSNEQHREEGGILTISDWHKAGKEFGEELRKKGEVFLRWETERWKQFWSDIFLNILGSKPWFKMQRCTSLPN